MFRAINLEIPIEGSFNVIVLVIFWNKSMYNKYKYIQNIKFILRLSGVCLSAGERHYRKRKIHC